MHGGDPWDEVLALDGLGQAALIRQGEITPAELLEAVIARIEARNPVLNAVIHPLFDRARAVAGDPGTLPPGPFRGVPFLLKDIVSHSAGDPFHCGMQALRDRDWREAADTWLTARFRRAGLVLVGKTNTPELATSITCEPVAYGATRNPWSLEHSPGGSSGGAAAAVASGMVAVAHANDMGGSIRIPAAACGLVGLKPTRGRTTLGPDLAELWGPLTHEHVVTRSVRDSAALLDALGGYAPGDIHVAPAPHRPFLDEVGADPGRLRIGVHRGPGHPEVVAGVEHAARLLASLGHHVELDHPGALDDHPSAGPLFPAIIAAEVDRLSRRIGSAIGLDELEAPTAMLVERGRSVRAVDWIRGREIEARWARAIAGWFRSYDLLVLPTMPVPPFLLGLLDPATVDPMTVLRSVGECVRFTAPFNHTGQPAISLPLHRGTEGLPIGVQLVARYGGDDVLVRVAAQLEAAAPWHALAPTA